jgi:hypothetical protein
MATCIPKNQYRRIAIVLLAALGLVSMVAIPADAWARGSHHESNHGELYKPGFWAQVVNVIKVHIVRPAAAIAGGASSGASCR